MTTNFVVILVALVVVVITPISTSPLQQQQQRDIKYTEDEIQSKLTEYNLKSIQYCNENSKASWAVQTDVGNKNKVDEMIKVSTEYANFRKEWWTIWQDASKDNYTSNTVNRQLLFLKDIGTAALNESDYQTFLTTTNEMSTIYNEAKICPYKQSNCTDTQRLSLDPEIEKIIATSRDYDELTYVWQAWHNASGQKMRSHYETYVDLMNKAAKANDYADASSWWQSAYENSNFVEMIDKLWTEIEPLYDELHTYVRYKLIEIYGNRIDAKSKTIPAHLLGNMWAQTWEYLYDETKPFEKASVVDVTSKLNELKYDARKMFELSNDFYLGMGLKANNMSYDPAVALIEKPTDGRTVACHASAWDFCDGNDFRIKMCTSVNMKDFITIHHEMGHIQYYLQYKEQPLALRGGANPGFHEAVGDTIALSVATPKHLQTIKLLDTDYDDGLENNNINALYSMALERLAFLPFGLLIDKWRWEVFSGAVTKENWNKRWWELREKYQKVSAPIERSELDFDPGAKYHVPANSQYIAYFVAHILEFQMYRALCIEAKQYDPNNQLHKCDFANSKEAGQKLSSGLLLGKTKPWPEALKEITGSDVLSSEAIVEYFQPLRTYLSKKNAEFANEQKIREQLETYNREASIQCTALQNAEWNSQTNVDNETIQNQYVEAVKKNADFVKQQYNEHFKALNASGINDRSIRRQVTFLQNLGQDKLDDTKLEQLTNTVIKMQTIYNTARVCPYKNQNCNATAEGLSLDPEIEDLLSESSDYDELAYVWEKWHDSTGNLMRDTYKEYVQLMNDAAKVNDFKDAAAMWQNDYEDENLSDNMNKLWLEIEPLYDELHTYVRYKLAKLYNYKFNPDRGYIPAHLLGNMWAQSWTNLFERIKPFTNASDLDVTASMKENGYTAKKMFEIANNFYMDLGLESTEMSYGPLAIIEKPTDRQIVCHASAWDFCDGKDFRIKQCTSINMNDFETVHHEMGHIQYYILYKDQPLPFRSGANPGFHEAVGDLIAMSVSTPKHLKKIGLIDNYEDTPENNINALFKMALDRLAFMPFGLLIDKYRWDIFSGNVSSDKWNQHWEDLRKKYQKVESPVTRSEVNFDAGAKYHVGANSQYMNYFFAHVLEFQLHKAMCIVAGEYDPQNSTSALHKCDIDKSKVAGQRLRDGLSLGMSEHWSVALEKMTNETELKAAALNEYFEPLKQFLLTENVKLKKESQMRATLSAYNQVANNECNALVTAEWNSQTDVNNQAKQDAYVVAVEKYATFAKEQYLQNFKGLNPNDFDDESIRRQVQFLSKLSTNALDSDDLNKLTKNVNNMISIYNNAKVCPFQNQKCNEVNEGMTLNSGITEVMGNSSNYDELKYVWQKWHENSGRQMRTGYAEYVELMNKAAHENAYKDAGEMWRADYEDKNFVENMNKLWQQIEPLYKELHTYVRRQLLTIYGSKMNATDPLIPAHLLGNMWAQSWVNLFERIKPYKDASDLDVTAQMIKQNYTPLKMFQESDNFYKSLGLESNEMSYTGESIIQEPTDRLIVCHASAWDFCNGKDFRIKQCTLINLVDFETTHHEMGHIQYYILYKDQPSPFKGGANPGFHEAVGDLIGLSVSTPAHLKKIGLLENYKNDQKDNINALLKVALKKVAFLPFGLLIDTYRWGVFNGSVGQSNLNGYWEELRERYQMIRSPVSRSENDFDAGAKYHVSANSQYINYFFAHILEFQLHKAMCIAAKQYDPNDKSKDRKLLHQCDIYQSREAGALLRAGLSLGMSKHWSEALRLMTNDTELRADALLEYFSPLHEYLKSANNPVAPEADDNTVPIVVGSVIGGMLVVALVGYIIYYFRKKK